MIDSHEHLILKYLQGTLSADERIIFDAWRNQSDENRKVVNDFQKIWDVREDGEKSADYQSDQEWIKLQPLLQHEEKTSIIPLNTKWYTLKIAAAITFILVASFLLYKIVSYSKEIVHETYAKIERVVLPDGSQVWLNENSRITYQNNFNNQRTLNLEGEGFFEVKPDPQKPFVITTDGAQVKVLGTSFNVKAYHSETQTEVLVVTGEVRFSSTDNNKSLVLLPGANGVLNKKDHTMISDTESHLNILAWKNKKLIFSKTPLHEVISTLRTYFKTEIQVKNEKLLNCRFTSSFIDPTLQEVIETLSVALNIQVEHQAEIYSLDGDGCDIN